ncbi:MULTISPECIES: Y-family DNA polymerase [Thalassospira]|uniref:DNA-directed DNA polymerase n=2 Tax=Thalassospira TaxID=168934 RepID=A0A367VZB9_9PROT|nr:MULTISPECIES: DNA polymerase Y family protein [Thalassospira]MDG4717818.1 DNA polymerase Y family protein [Thalassospira sp. FZY0004]RCK30336.1 nucleotidyltransferase [Thalassospira profundimaris]
MITRTDHKGVFVCGLNKAARNAGLHGGMRLSDARSILPDLQNMPEEAELLGRHMAQLVRHMDRYSPWVAPDRELHVNSLIGDGGLWLEITGGSHLFGGEAAMIGKIMLDMKHRGHEARVAIADTAAAAWAAARHHPGTASERILSLPEDHGVASRFPVSSLRLPDDIIALLSRLGLKQLGDITPLPRANITTRMGPDVLRRLDQFYGRLPEHLDFELPDTPWLVKQGFAEPLGDADNLALAIEAMTATLCDRLKADNLGLRRIMIRIIRVDGHRHTITSTTSTPCQSPKHILRLLAEKMPGVDTGFGIEQVIIHAPWVEHVTFRQARLDRQQDQSGDATALAQLIDRLSHHLEPNDILYRPAHHASHLPERAAIRQAPTSTSKPARLAGVILPKRPVRLFEPPEPAEVILRTPGGAPIRLRWRKIILDVSRVEGPERICPEWWEHLDRNNYALSQMTRDYFRILDRKGRMLWLFRTGHAGQDIWSVHGLFAG